MNGNCVDVGTIQAFLDGELTSEAATNVSGHIADCDSCSVMLSQAEEESAFVFPVLERELNSLVPTQRLWSKINDSIAVEKENTPIWKKLWSGSLLGLRNPSVAVAASVLIVVGVFAAVYISRSNTTVLPKSDTIVARSDRRNIPETPAFVEPVNSVAVVSPNEIKRRAFAARRPEVVQADYRPAVASIREKAPELKNAEYLPGEESYVKTISSLSQSVDGQKDAVMRPSQQIAYERDLAVVNDSIKRMRVEVRKDPKNESAKQVLYNSYQNKIDLLNSVAQKEELVASLK